MIKGSNNTFMKRALNANIPVEVTMELTYRCNLRCIHCYLEGETGEEMTSEDICRIIDQLAEAGTLQLIFTGGEALLRKDFFDIASYARRKNFALSLITNGTLIGREEARTMGKLNFYNVSISIYGLKCHDEVTCSKGSLEKSLNAVKLLNEEGINVDIKAPVMNINYEEIEELSKYCTGLGVEFSPNPTITLCSNGSRRPLQYRMNDSQLTGYLDKRIENGEKVQGFKAFCNAGLTLAAISPGGKVYPCIALKRCIGSLRSNSFKEIWDNSPYLRWLRTIKLSHLKECVNCPSREICTLCPAEALEEEGNLLAPHRETCRIAFKRSEILGGKKV